MEKNLELRKYRIQEIHGSIYFVVLEDYTKKEMAVLRGKMRILEQDQDIPLRNPCCVGDYVLINPKYSEQNKNKNYLVIEEILPRKNMLVRSSPTEMHLLGSNLDFAVLICSIKEPDLSTGFIDRFLIACFHQKIPPIIIFTKCDLLNPDNSEDVFFVEQTLYYKKIIKNVYWDNLLQPGKIELLYQILEKLKIKNNIKNLNDFLQEFTEGTILLAGQSGTGKSTLTNLIMKKPIQKVKETSKYTGKGKHTTTTSSLFKVPYYKNMILIDTPGIKEWGLSHLTRKEIYESYPEWEDRISNCKFRNCEHLPEMEGCKIQVIIKSNLLPDWRIENLKHIIDSLDYYERIRTGDYKKPTGRFHNKFK